MEILERNRLLKSGDWRQYVIDEARTWRGTPYQHKGRVKGVGVDCGGMIYQIYNPLLGPFKPFPKDYAQDWSVHRDNEIYLDFISDYVIDVPRPVPGGLVMVKIARCFAHACIFTERNTIIHAWGRTQHGSVIENKLQFFRHPGGALRDMKFLDVKWD